MERKKKEKKKENMRCRKMTIQQTSETHVYESNQTPNKHFSEKFNDPKIEEAGEDADPLCKYLGSFFLACVFDGLGGAGSQQLTIQGLERSSAYFASREVCKYTDEFLTKVLSENSKVDNSVINNLEKNIYNRLTKFNQSIKKESKLKSSLIKSLPTTVSGVLVDLSEDDNIHCHNFWAGDSRNYILNKIGLRQTTNDDLKQDFDAYENLKGDSQMSNFVNADKEFVLNYKKVIIEDPSIIFCVTDGAFDYLPTPMDFEILLLECIELSNSFPELIKNFSKKLKEIPIGDDVSGAFLFYGWESYEEMKDEFTERQKQIHKSYFSTIKDDLIQRDELEKKLEDMNKSLKQKIMNINDKREKFWDDYKNNYYS